MGLIEKGENSEDRKRIRKEDEDDEWIEKTQKELGIWKIKEELVEGIRNNKVGIVSGDTGSGKSTQLVQYLYADYLHSRGNKENDCFPFKAIVTQPR